MARNSTTFSEASECSCNEVDFSEAQAQLENGIRSLADVNDKLHTEMTENAVGKGSRSCTLKSALFTLQTVDNKLQDVLKSIDKNPSEDNEIASNFGMSVKVDLAKKKLENVREKHRHLRTEWYNHDVHLNKIAAEVKGKDDELKRQSIFCTTQGLILSKMLWKSTKSNELLDVIVAQDKMVIEFLNMLDGCLYGFGQTYRHETPEPSSDEYQYVLSLCGILSNLASVPDGRFLLTNQPVCREVFDQIVNVLPGVSVPNAESLKWLMLTAIYNIMIYKEGEEYARNNQVLLRVLSQCLNPAHSNRLLILTLKIMDNLTKDIADESYGRYVNENLPFETLERLQCCKESQTIHTGVHFEPLSNFRRCFPDTTLAFCSFDD